MKTYKIYADESHAWLEVDFKELDKLNINHKISKCSYINEKTNKVYLEEDCDLPLFLKAKYPSNDDLGIDLSKFNIEEIFIKYENNPIRHYPIFDLPF